MSHRNDATAFAGYILVAALLVLVLILVGTGAYVGSQLGDTLSHVVTVTR